MNGASSNEDARDCALLTRIGEGDESAFADFYRLYDRRLGRFIASKLNDPADAADILHVTFMEVWRGASRFEGRSRVSTWVFGIAYRKIVDHIRKRRPDAQSIDDLADELPDEGPSAFDRTVQSEERTNMHTCLGRLKPVQRTVLQLAFLEGMGYRDIAQSMSCPEGTVKTRVLHAKSALRACLERLLGKDGGQ